jgi:hypothetical protein
MARRQKPKDDMAVASAHTPQNIPTGVMKADFERMMPGYRKRHDGWNQQRLQRFLDVLAHTGCVEDACRCAGMSDVAPYRAKKKYPLFSEAWDDALARSRQGLIAIAYKRAVEGRETIIIRKGEEYERRIEPSDSMLGLLLKQGDLKGQKTAYKAEEVITAKEMNDGWYFDSQGVKRKRESHAELKERLNAKFAQMRERLYAYSDAEGVCNHCNAPLKPGVTNAMLYDERN